MGKRRGFRVTITDRSNNRRIAAYLHISFDV